MILAFVFFIFLFFVIVALSHFFALSGLLMVFEPALKTKKMLQALCIVLPIVMLVFLIMARQIDNPLFRLGYQAIMAWHGLLINLMLAGAAMHLFFFLKNKLGLSVDPAKLFYGLAAAAVALTVYGIYNAHHPRVKQYNARIENLPAAWEQQTIVHLSDIHLGINFQKKFLDGIISQVNQVRPKLLVITGDLHDGSAPDIDGKLAAFDNLEKNIEVIFINGNHEIYNNADTDLSPFVNIYHFLKNETVDIDGLRIIGLDYSNPDLRLLGQGREGPAVLLFHEPKFIKQAKAAGIDLQLAGHTHAGQQFPINLITRLIYGRYHRGFRQEGVYHINTSVGVGAWGPPVRIGSVPEIAAITLTK